METSSAQVSQMMDMGAPEVSLIPEFCPGGQGQRLTVNKSILLV